MRNLLLILAGCGLLSACIKHNGHSGGGGSSSVTVYAAGCVYGGPYNQACYWKNGQITLLPPTPNTTTNSFAYGIWVQDTNVYVVGTTYLGMTLWTNGVPQVIGDLGATPNAVAATGNNVYIAGYDNAGYNSVAKIWTNGQPDILNTPYPTAGATAILLSGGDIFTLGSVGNGYGQIGLYAGYWKNGDFTGLTADTTYSTAGGIAVNNGDVYIAGTIQNFISGAGYWKNGMFINLPSDSTSPGASAISFAGNDLYIAGGVYNRTLEIFNAVYWRNGVQSFLTDPSVQSAATCMTTNGSDVYIGGMQATPIGNGPTYNEFEATYWKNGVATTLSWPGGGPGYRYVYAIFVAGGNSSVD